MDICKTGRVCPTRPSITRVLIVDDYEPWRRFLRLALIAHDRFEVIGEASDGFEALEKARQLQPDLVLLDIGLPKLNGIETARRLPPVSPTSKILFVSGNRSWSLAEEGLRAGAGGYVVKSSAASELLAAIGVVMEGKLFLSSSLASPSLSDCEEPALAGLLSWKRILAAPQPESVIARRHEAGFYSDHRGLLDALTQFIGSTLKVGNSVIVVATESHRNHLLAGLQKYGLNVVAAVEQGKYTALDAGAALASVMVAGKLDAMRALAMFEDLIAKAEAARGGPGRVAIFGEGVQLLWAEAKAEAAIEMEHVANQLAQRHADVDILCGYSLTSFQDGVGRHMAEKVCAAHSAVHMW